MNDWANKKEYKNNQFVVILIFSVLLFIFLLLCIKELIRIYKYSNWIGPYPTVSRVPDDSYFLLKNLKTFY
jgi:hypothetical protein